VAIGRALGLEYRVVADQQLLAARQLGGDDVEEAGHGTVGPGKRGHRAPRSNRRWVALPLCRTWLVPVAQAVASTW